MYVKEGGMSLYRESLMVGLTQSVDSKDLSPLRNQLQKTTKKNNGSATGGGGGGSDDHSKMILDAVFRDYVSKHLSPSSTTESSSFDTSLAELLIDFAISGARDDLTTPTLPIVLLSDLFDIITLENCEKLFRYGRREKLFISPI